MQKTCIVLQNKEPNVFAELAEFWLLSKKERIKQSTYLKYQYLLDQYISPQLGNLEIRELSTRVLDLSMSAIYQGKDGERISTSLMKSIFYITHAVLNYGIRANYISPVAITFEINQDSSREMITLSKHHEQKIVRYMLDHKSANHLGILLALYTGMRIGEICSLQRSDIDLIHAVIHVRKTVQRLRTNRSNRTELMITKPKSFKSYRDIPIPDFLMQQIQEYEIGSLPDDFFILNRRNVPYEPRTLQYGFKRLLCLCDVEYMNFHCLRHTFATKCIHAGFDVKTLSEILGHANVNFTMNRYVHSDMA